MVGHGKPWSLKQDFLRPVCFASGWNLDDGELQREFHLPSDSLSRPPPETLLWFSVHYHKIFWHFWTCWPKGLHKHGAMPSKNARNHAAMLIISMARFRSTRVCQLTGDGDAGTAWPVYERVGSKTSFGALYTLLWVVQSCCRRVVCSYGRD